MHKLSETLAYLCLSHVIPEAFFAKIIVKLVRKFEKVDFKHRKAALDLNFLKTCRSFNVIPKFLQFCVANRSLRGSQAYQKCLNHLQLVKINNKEKNLKVLVNEVSSVKSTLLRILNFLDFNHVCNIISNKEKSVLNCKYSHKKKLSDLIPGYENNPTRFSHDPNKVIFNFSSNVVIEEEKSLLCKGLRFCIPPKKIEYADLFTQFELLYRDIIMFEMKSENRDFLKNKLKDIFFSTFKSHSFDKVKNDQKSIALKNLIERKDLVIQKASKGNTVVIKDRTEYLEGIKSLRFDSSKFMQTMIIVIN